MTSRRVFLQGSAGVLLGLGAAGCRPADGRSSASGLAPLTRPVLRSWADDILWIDTPAAELPVAYVSMDLRRVFVDRAFRDRASWLLDAHISVSTALWRIPLPGDPEGQPVMPGDSLREFEEFPMREWDPSMIPELDDIRIVRGRPVARRIDFACVPLAGGISASVRSALAAREDAGAGDATAPVEAWLSGGPFEVEVSDGSTVETVREDFRIVGTGRRFEERACAGAGTMVQYLGWGRRD